MHLELTRRVFARVARKEKGMAQMLHLGYHYVRDGAAPGPCCSPARLRQQLQWLKHNHWAVLTCGEVALEATARLPKIQRK